MINYLEGDNMSRLEIDKNNPLYDLIDVFVKPGKKMTIAQLVEAYKELESLKWLKGELIFISEYVKENFSRSLDNDDTI